MAKRKSAAADKDQRLKKKRQGKTNLEVVSRKPTASEQMQADVSLLQRTLGNEAVTRLAANGTMPRKPMGNDVAGDMAEILHRPLGTNNPLPKTNHSKIVQRTMDGSSKATLIKDVKALQTKLNGHRAALGSDTRFSGLHDRLKGLLKQLEGVPERGWTPSMPAEKRLVQLARSMESEVTRLITSGSAQQPSPAPATTITTTTSSQEEQQENNQGGATSSAAATAVPPTQATQGQYQLAKLVGHNNLGPGDQTKVQERIDAMNNGEKRFSLHIGVGGVPTMDVTGTSFGSGGRGDVRLQFFSDGSMKLVNHDGKSYL